MSLSETGLTKNRIISELTRSPHGKLVDYIPVGIPAVRQEPEFFAHLIAWDALKGQVRDAHVALPVVMLHAGLDLHNDFVDNALAHLAKLNPRELLRAYRFALEIKLPSRMRRMRLLVETYLRALEAQGHWQRVALQHRAVLKELYAVTHTHPSLQADTVLFKNDYTHAHLFAAVAALKDMSAQEAAGTIIEKKLPFLVALGALGKKAKEVDLVLALINRMTPTELVTNTKMLERLGVKTNPALRGAFEQALAKSSTGKANVLKTTRAAEAIQDESLKAKLQGVQEKQLAGIATEGNWLVLADKSGSMQQAIEAARHIAATLSKLVKGKVWLVFFDTMPLTIDIPPGTSLDIVKAATQHIRADGGTSIGCGLRRMLDEHVEIDGIAIVSDGCENQAPLFWDVYARYSKEFDKEVPVYLYLLEGNDYPYSREAFLHGHDIQVFDIRHQHDYYSLPNLVATMRTNRYSLVDEIMSTKLLKLSDVLKSTGKEVSASA